jgi:hypothetical protein|tara:strand:- start:39 stop:206 length:168 start_codon:yes stop_codon:yes gene_type:complete
MKNNARAHVSEAGMVERAALPCVLTWDANDEVERHDCYELAAELGGIGENLLSGA